MQNIYTNIYKIIKRKGYNYINNEKAFVIKIAKRELYKYYLFKKKSNVLYSYDEELLESIKDEKIIDIDDYLFQNIEIEKIWKEIKKENILTQKIMVLYYLEDTCINEISSLLDINENTVKSKLYRAISKLKEKFGDQL
jgi:RNA polymerase sigma-70 factor (ECF subfamily)